LQVDKLRYNQGNLELIEDTIMAGGWSRDGAVQDQIDASVEDAVERARSQLPTGESLLHCEECDNEIPEARRQAVPGVRFCIDCQSILDEQQAGNDSFNRRGSKDSQLR
jgi:phage/conjugal plasmid C-4 type zinc finger TraR family protein